MFSHSFLYNHRTNQKKKKLLRLDVLLSCNITGISAASVTGYKKADINSNDNTLTATSSAFNNTVSKLLASSWNITATFKHPNQTSGKTTCVPISQLCPCESPVCLFHLRTTQTQLFFNPRPTWVQRTENRPSVIELYFTDNSSPFNGTLTARLWFWLLSWRASRADRKARCGSLQCNLVLITTSLSLQQAAHSLGCHFRDNTINQMWTSPSTSHISFPTSSTRSVILIFFRPEGWQTSAVGAESVITVAFHQSEAENEPLL